MVRLWVAGKTVCDRNVTHGPYLRARDKGLIIKRYMNSPVYFTLDYTAYITCCHPPSIYTGTTLYSLVTKPQGANNLPKIITLPSLTR